VMATRSVSPTAPADAESVRPGPATERLRELLQQHQTIRRTGALSAEAPIDALQAPPTTTQGLSATAVLRAMAREGGEPWSAADIARPHAPSDANWGRRNSRTDQLLMTSELDAVRDPRLTASRQVVPTIPLALREHVHTAGPSARSDDALDSARSSGDAERWVVRAPPTAPTAQRASLGGSVPVTGNYKAFLRPRTASQSSVDDASDRTSVLVPQAPTPKPSARKQRRK
jgi:hypothetical protein